MTTPTDTDLAQALRELLDSHDHVVECDYADQRAADERECAARVAARELLAAHERAQPASVAGWVTVPREPTDEMLVAGQEAWWHKRSLRDSAIEDCHEARDVYRAMLIAAQSEAAPQPQASGENHE